MPGMSRIVDIGVGICYGHSAPIPMVGIIITSSSNVTSEGRGNARFCDIVLGMCGHCGIIITGSPDIHVNDRPATRVGDIFVGTFIGIIAQGAGTVIGN